MTPAILDNLLSWSVQVLVIAALGGLLPFVFRIQHPRSHLIYCHMLLIACLVAPVAQPWQHPTVAVSQNSVPVPVLLQPPVSAPVVSTVPWDRVILWTLVAGVALRLAWLGVGLWQIRRYRASARPLYPTPKSVIAARAMTRADAFFGISPRVPGPVTFGLLRPVVLLPESFLGLDEDAQCGIVCHELLHVRRKDWVVTLLEEFVSVVLWFHPAICWLLSQTRLSREQVVDSEVVMLTANREPYINALLAMAGARPGLDLAPAPLFLRRRHLSQRLHSLLSEVSMSRIRLLSSYSSMAAILAMAGWAVFVSFPLVGEAQQSAPGVTGVLGGFAEQSGVTINAGGNVVRRLPIVYSNEAIQKKVEGSVFAELTVNSAGEVLDARIISGADELRRSVLQSVLQWRYERSVAPTRTIVVDVNFRLPSGTMVTVTPPPDPPPPPPPPRPSGQLVQIGALDVSSLSPSTGAQMLQAFQSFRGLALSDQVGDQLREAFRAIDPNVALQIRANAGGTANVKLVPRTLSQEATAEQELKRLELQRILAEDPAARPIISVESNVQRARLIQQVQPEYPPLAKASQVQGLVTLEAVINPEGRMDNLRVLKGHPLLTNAAIDAVKQWIYTPTIIDGRPVSVRTEINVNFAFQP